MVNEKIASKHIWILSFVRNNYISLNLSILNIVLN